MLVAGCRQETTPEVADRNLQRHQDVILYDLGHNNLDDPETLDLLSNWLKPHGYSVRKNEQPFNHDALAEVDILMVRNALLHPNDEQWTRPTPSAFTSAEIDVVDEWVRAGGSLVVVADHMPVAGAARSMLSRFQVDTSDGFAVDAALLTGYEVDDIMRAAYLKFSKEDGTVLDHVVNEGGPQSQQLSLVTTHVGSAFRLPEHGEPLLRLKPGIISLLPDHAWKFSDKTPRLDVSGWLQGGVVRVGKGRVAILGDSQLLTVPSPESEEFNDFEPAEGNMQFTLNLFHWLSGRL